MFNRRFFVVAALVVSGLSLAGSSARADEWSDYAAKLTAMQNAANAAGSLANQIPSYTAAFNNAAKSKNVAARQQARAALLDHLLRTSRAYSDARNLCDRASDAFYRVTRQRGAFNGWQSHVTNIEAAQRDLRTAHDNVERLRQFMIMQF